MAIPPTTVRVRQSSERVRISFLSQELQPFFGKARMINDPGVGRWIQWQATSPTTLAGKIPYLRGKNISQYVFASTLSAEPDGTRVTLTATRGSFAAVAIPMVYVLGLLMCCVGVIFPLIAIPRFEKLVAQAVASSGSALSAWDRSLGGHTAPDAESGSGLDPIS